MLVVADTSPLNYLVWIESVEILPRLYGRVIIPPEVRDELLAADAPAVVQSWANALPNWIEVQAPDAALRDDPRWQSLDLGERAALALATARQPSILLIDERAGSAIARSLGLSVTGTLGVLDEAARRKFISLPEAIDRLKRTSFVTLRRSFHGCSKRIGFVPNSFVLSPFFSPFPRPLHPSLDTPAPGR